MQHEESVLQAYVYSRARGLQYPTGIWRRPLVRNRVNVSLRYPTNPTFGMKRAADKLCSHFRRRGISLERFEPSLLLNVVLSGRDRDLSPSSI